MNRVRPIFATLHHIRNIDVAHIGNKVVFHIPLHLEAEMGLMVKEVRVEMGRMIVETIKRIDVTNVTNVKNL